MLRRDTSPLCCERSSLGFMLFVLVARSSVLGVGGRGGGGGAGWVGGGGWGAEGWMRTVLDRPINRMER